MRDFHDNTPSQSDNVLCAAFKQIKLRKTNKRLIIKWLGGVEGKIGQELPYGKATVSHNLLRRYPTFMNSHKRGEEMISS